MQRHSHFLTVLILAVLSRPVLAEPGTMTAHFIDVGQADATLLEFPCGAILIDAGAADDFHANVLVEYLQKFFERRETLNRTLDLIIITHNHIDHNQALMAVMTEFTVKRYIDNGSKKGSGKAYTEWIREKKSEGLFSTELREITDSAVQSAGVHGLTDDFIDPLACDGDGNPKISILSGRVDENPGWSLKKFRNQNNHSISVRVDFGESSFLFTGDLEDAAIETLVHWYRDTDTLDVDVYQVGHHGSFNGTTDGLLTAMSPNMAVISCGKWFSGRRTLRGFNTFSYGHPRETIVEKLTSSVSGQRGSPKKVMVASKARKFHEDEVSKAVYATAWDGHVLIEGKTDSDPKYVE